MELTYNFNALLMQMVSVDRVFADCLLLLLMMVTMLMMMDAVGLRSCPSEKQNGCC